jgi:hypothetical protein
MLQLNRPVIVEAKPSFFFGTGKSPPQLVRDGVIHCQAKPSLKHLFEAAVSAKTCHRLVGQKSELQRAASVEHTATLRRDPLHNFHASQNLIPFVCLIFQKATCAISLWPRCILGRGPDTGSHY